MEGLQDILRPHWPRGRAGPWADDGLVALLREDHPLNCAAYQRVARKPLTGPATICSQGRLPHQIDADGSQSAHPYPSGRRIVPARSYRAHPCRAHSDEPSASARSWRSLPRRASSCRGIRYRSYMSRARPMPSPSTEPTPTGLSRTAIVAASVGEQDLAHGPPGRSRSQVNLHPSVDHRTLVGPDALPWPADAAAGAEVEPPEVAGAGDHAVPDQAARQRGLAVRAPVVDCVRLPVGERHAYHVPVMLGPAGGPLAEFPHGADPYPAHG
jgi:hypothetical protein